MYSYCGHRYMTALTAIQLNMSSISGSPPELSLMAIATSPRVSPLANPSHVAQPELSSSESGRPRVIGA